MITKEEICKKLTGIGWRSVDPNTQAVAQYAALVISSLQTDLDKARKELECLKASTH